MTSRVVRKIISTGQAATAIGPYSQAVQVDKMLYVSGQLGFDPKTKVFVHDSDAAAQARQALENIGTILAAAGSRFGNVVKCTVLLKNMADFQKVNQVYIEYFPTNKPARVCYQVPALPADGLVEIDAIAIVGDVEDATAAAPGL